MGFVRFPQLDDDDVFDDVSGDDSGCDDDGGCSLLVSTIHAAAF